jgi:hypothetical protein
MAHSTLTVAGFAHDMTQKKSCVNFAWAGDPSKRLGREVPFGLPLDQLKTEARKAPDALSSELAARKVKAW